MSTITVHLGPEINTGDVTRIRTALPRLGKNDQLMIVMEATDAHQAGVVINLLEEHGFDYQPRGSHDGQDYHIIAKRKELH